MQLSPARVIDWIGDALNLRDFGGYPTNDGRTVRPEPPLSYVLPARVAANVAHKRHPSVFRSVRDAEREIQVQLQASARAAVNHGLRRDAAHRIHTCFAACAWWVFGCGTARTPQAAQPPRVNVRRQNESCSARLLRSTAAAASRAANLGCLIATSRRQRGRRRPRTLEHGHATARGGP
jgi:hypothetical protein